MISEKSFQERLDEKVKANSKSFKGDNRNTGTMSRNHMISMLVNSSIIKKDYLYR